MSSPISWRCEKGLGVVVIDRPERKNSLTLQHMHEVGAAFGECVDDGARCILIRGAGDMFCAGRDLLDMDAATEDTEAVLRDRINPALAAVRGCGVPTIASVKGPALGFGFGLALACDITVVADNALMGSPFRNIGCTLDSGGHYYMRERIGVHRAAELIFTGRLISGREAAAMGLVNRSMGALDLDGYVDALARSIAQGPTAAFAATKRILASQGGYDDMAELEAHYQARLLRTSDGIEGLTAFKEKRKPRFSGS
ncbi:MAG: enoyl-CoA hydratase-related protein [Candidimonas sp.]|jgi:2-(1,2-epoxy-1,2-dihydrophenyl)acetyl-CoA isomerase